MNVPIPIWTCTPIQCSLESMKHRTSVGTQFTNFVSGLATEGATTYKKPTNEKETNNINYLSVTLVPA